MAAHRLLPLCVVAAATTLVGCTETLRVPPPKTSPTGVAGTSAPAAYVPGAPATRQVCPPGAEHDHFARGRRPPGARPGLRRLRRSGGRRHRGDAGSAGAGVPPPPRVRSVGHRRPRQVHRSEGASHRNEPRRQSRPRARWHPLDRRGDAPADADSNPPGASRHQRGRLIGLRVDAGDIMPACGCLDAEHHRSWWRPAAAAARAHFMGASADGRWFVGIKPRRAIGSAR